MKQKKLKFTLLGLVIFCMLGSGFMFFLKIQDSIIWTALMTNISALVGVFSVTNHKDKKVHIENQNKEDIQ